METEVIEKMALSGIIGLLLGFLGELNIILIIYLSTMVLDYVTGTCVALKRRIWSSSYAFDGLFKKAGSMAAIVVAAIIDALIYSINMFYSELDLVTLNRPLFSCVVIVWYIFTELGSITENIGNLGVPIPAFLAKRLKQLTNQIEQEGDNVSAVKHKKKK